MTRRHFPNVTTGRAVTPASSSPLVKDPTILFDEKSTSTRSRPFAAGDNEILVIRACLPPGVTLSVETGRIPTGLMPTGDSCRGVICVPYDTSMTDVCPLTVCCTAQSMSSCGNLVALPPLPGFVRLVLAPLAAVGTVKVFVETVSFDEASMFPDNYWLGGCPLPPAPLSLCPAINTLPIGVFECTDLLVVKHQNGVCETVPFPPLTITGTLPAGITPDINGNATIGKASLATNATDGFLYIPTCAGPPTGVPTTKTGYAPLVIDRTNGKMYFYSGGAWIPLN